MWPSADDTRSVRTHRQPEEIKTSAPSANHKVNFFGLVFTSGEDAFLFFKTQHHPTGKRQEIVCLPVCRCYNPYCSHSPVLTGLQCSYLITDEFHHVPQHLPYKAEILFVHISIIFWNIASQDA